MLAMIALLWTLPDSRPAGRLPKYNPQRKNDLFDFRLASMSATLPQLRFMNAVSWKSPNG